MSQPWPGAQEGHRVVALGLALTLTAVAVNVLLVGELSLFFDLCFVVVCLVVALAVRPGDFFVVGVLPPLVMLGVLVLLAVAAPDAVARSGDGVVQATVSGLAHHSGGLVAGYLVCLGTLAVRHRARGRALLD